RHNLTYTPVPLLLSHPLLKLPHLISTFFPYTTLFRSEYLVMASELLMIKSKMLLPHSEEVDDLDDDPRENLVERLIEYQNYKEYTVLLNEKRTEREKYYSKHPTDLTHLESNETWDPNNTIDLTELIIAYQK